MVSGLFRRQAIRHQQNRLHGDVVVLPSLPHVTCTLLLAIWFLLAAVWVINSQYAKKETVSGWLEPPSGLIRVFPETSQGKIKEVLVKHGQRVEVSDPLLIINGDRFLTDGKSLEGKLIEEYQLQKHIVEEQLQRSEHIHALQIQDTNARLQSSKEDLSRLEAQITTLSQRYQLQQKRVNNYSRMFADGHVSDNDLDNEQQHLLAIKSEYQQMLREQTNQQNLISQLVTQQTLAPQIHQNETTQLQTKLSEINQQIEQIKSQRTYVIRATRAGVVTSLQASSGQRVNINQPLLTLLPLDGEIEAKLLVPVSAAGFIKKEQGIDIRYDAFPYQKFGLYKATIKAVSDSVMLPGEIHASPIQFNQPVYMIEAVLKQQFVSGYGQSMPLKSGMTLSADIKLAERSVLEWLLEPIYSLRGRL